MSKTFAYLGLAMGAVFVLFGILVAVAPPNEPLIYQNNYLISAIVVIYGLFRIYRSYMILKQYRNNI